ncbi:MAG: hypothetical protein K6B67_07375 [Lachnospiraceae bacterium]|nr:hypothetical protein [Lachnospiraceae bacterium]
MIRSEETTLINMSNECLDFPYIPKNPDVYLNYYGMNGINCYLDDEARGKISKDLMNYGPEGIHYIDNGNYHYLSLLYLEMIEEDFALVLYDNHPDMKPPAFGGITSCGGWVLEAAENIGHLKRIYMIGMEAGLVEEVMPLHSKVCYVKCYEFGQWKIYQRGSDIIDKTTKSTFLNDLSNMDILEVLADETLPLALSLDLDALALSDFSCQWSQGILTAKEMEKQVREIIKEHEVIMLDVCG